MKQAVGQTVKKVVSKNFCGSSVAVYVYNDVFFLCLLPLELFLLSDCHVFVGVFLFRFVWFEWLFSAIAFVRRW